MTRHLGTLCLFLCCTSLTLLACDSGDDEPASAKGAAGEDATGSAAGAPAPAAGTGGDSGTASDPADAGGDDEPAPDAAADDAGPSGPRCGDGEMPCDDECIPAIAPKLDEIHDRILATGCALSSSCHTGISPKEGLDLTSPKSTLEFVDKASAQEPGAKIFDTKTPEDSYLLRKLRGMNIAAMGSTGRLSTQMPPPPSLPLCEEKIEVIEAWVRAGAKP